MNETNDYNEEIRTHRLSGNLTVSFPALLQSEARRILEERDISQNELAEKMKVFPNGARRILQQDIWTVKDSFKVLEALGVTIEIDFVEPPESDSL